MQSGRTPSKMARETQNLANSLCHPRVRVGPIQCQHAGGVHVNTGESSGKIMATAVEVAEATCFRRVIRYVCRTVQGCKAGWHPLSRGLSLTMEFFTNTLEVTVNRSLVQGDSPSAKTLGRERDKERSLAAAVAKKGVNRMALTTQKVANHISTRSGLLVLKNACHDAWSV